MRPQVRPLKIVNLAMLVLACAVTIRPAQAQESAPPSGPPAPPPSGQAKETEADPAKTQPAEAAWSAPAAQPAEAKDGAPLPAVVIEVSGKVEWAAAGVSPLVTEGWTAVALEDQLSPTTQIRTGLRSHVNLKFGETTTVSIRSITHASIEQFYRSASTEHVRIGLGYGTVRGGSSEGAVRSDVMVDSPVATLAKRGTEGWEMQVEPGFGRFRISLAEYGLVEALQKLGAGRTRSRQVRPGEYADETNIANMWISQDMFNRVVYFHEPQSVSQADADFMLENNRGYSTLAPGGGTALIDLSGRVSADFVLSQTAGGVPVGAGAVDLAIGLPVVRRPEGNFGTPRTFRAIRSR